MGYFGVRHDGGSENTVGIALAQRHYAVRGEQHRSRDIVEFRLLILPAGAEISLELRVLFKLRVAVCGEHFAVGVDVYALAVGLLQKQLHIVQVMTADHYERSLFNCEWDFSRDRVAVCFGVEKLQTFEVHRAGLEHQRKQHVLRLVLAEVVQSFIEELVDLPAGLAEHPGMVGVGRHTLQPEQNQ